MTGVDYTLRVIFRMCRSPRVAHIRETPNNGDISVGLATTA